MLADSLTQHGVSDKEGLLDITLDKSVRVCLTGRKKRTTGILHIATAGSI